MYMQATTINSIAKGLGTITAQGSENGDDYSGFAFLHCKITGTGDTYLGRAWRQNPRVVFAYTEMGSLINSKGWSDSASGEAKEYATILLSLFFVFFFSFYLLFRGCFNIYRIFFFKKKKTKQQKKKKNKTKKDA
jgi:hypothetical protein